MMPADPSPYAPPAAIDPAPEPADRRTVLVLRLLIVASIALGIAGAALGGPAPAAEEPEAYDWLAQAFLLVLLVAGLVLVIATVGLLRLRPGSHRWAIVGTAVLWLLSAVTPGPPTVETALVTSLGHLSSTLWGAALAMTCLPPLRRVFAPG